MKILFCTLHVRRSLQAVSLAAGCLAAALPEDLSVDAELLDFFPEQSNAEIVSEILRKASQAIAFSVYVWNRKRIVELAKELHRKAPDVFLIAGGPEATGDTAELASAAPWTALVTGEGETALGNLLTNLSKGDLQTPLPGISFIQDGQLVSGGSFCPHDIDNAVSPWLNGTLKPQRGGGILWEVARGCAFSCDYCFDARGHKGVRPLPRKRLEDELELFSQAEISQVWVLDSTFNYPPERGVDLLKLLLEKAPHLHYHLEAKADFIDRHTASLLGGLNCSLQIGLQSIHRDVLQEIHRPLALDVLTEKVHLLEAEGIIYGFDLIYGLPHDNYAGFRDSIDTVLSFAPNHVHIFPLSILPGTRLAENREKYGIKAQSEPPYELLSSANWTEEDLLLCKRLSSAVEIFYNTGRAVAFFPAIVQALKVNPSELFENFFAWATRQEGVATNLETEPDNLTEDDAYRLIQGFLCDQLRRTGQGHLVSVFLDLLCYHFHYAETLLGKELLPPPATDLPQAEIWETPWVRSREFRLVPFAYEILDLLEMEEMQLEELAELFRPVGSVALFMRRGNDVFCESLGDEMLHLLKQSDGTRSPKDIFAGSVSQETGEELVRFAIEEGLLLLPPSLT